MKVYKMINLTFQHNYVCYIQLVWTKTADELNQIHSLTVGGVYGKVEIQRLLWLPLYTKQRCIYKHYFIKHHTKAKWKENATETVPFRYTFPNKNSSDLHRSRE